MPPHPAGPELQATVTESQDRKTGHTVGMVQTNHQGCDQNNDPTADLGAEPKNGKPGPITVRALRARPM